MRKTTCILLVFTLYLVQAECRLVSFPNLFGHLTNTTAQFTQLIRQRTREFKKNYIENVREKIASFFSDSEPEVNAVSISRPEQLRVKRKHSAPPPETSVVRRYRSNKTPAPAPTPKPTVKCSNDDPMNHMTTPQLIAVHGYPAESHTVVTDDGYILTIHRIPNYKNNTKQQRTVLLHHGLLGSSADWVISGPGKALAYILSDAGYDVWMANARGNTYSRAHISKPIDSYAFWNFTFHDISQHDLPAVIDYIMEIKSWNVKINYIGHSMGTTVLFALLSTKTQYNKVLRAGYALAPVAYMTDIRSPIRIFAKFANNLEYLMKLLGANEFLPQNTVLKWLSKHMCEINHYEEAICENSMFVICGHDPKQFNQSLLPMILGHTPAGASTKTLVHYAQIIHNDGIFQQFDYGLSGNLAQYGTAKPPVYPLHNITLPIALLSAENDWLASDVDVTNLYVQLANPVEHYIVPLKEFNHIDFLYAIDAPTLVYSKLLHLLEDGFSSRTYFNPDLISSLDYYNVDDKK